MRTLVASLVFSACAVAATNSTPVTFDKEVLPILQKRCQDCHRPGEVAPMSLLTYSDARPWAKSIRQAVLTKKMPPWFADPNYGHFSNDRSLSQPEIDTIIAWVDGGAKEGDPKDAPAPRQFVEGWNIGKPDLVIEMPSAFHVPSTGVIDYQYVILPTHLNEDKWVLAAEVRPGHREVMHHVITRIREPGSKWMPDMQSGVVFVPPKGSRGGELDGGLSGYVPGENKSLEPLGSPRNATLLKAGSDIVFQLHYTPNGTAVDDQTKIGIIFAKAPPAQRLIGGNSAAHAFAIPPGDSNYKVEASSTVQYDCDLYSMMPHAHLRGKSFEYRIVRPDGTSETVLKVPRYDFHWQLTYYLDKPIHLPKGTKVEVTAYYDNSANNVNNPDPTKEVHWGEQTFEEMMMGYFSVVVDAANAPVNARRGAQSAALAPASIKQ
jgi:Copper type II ascorbate-dependent monooxygenase, C-terminal domain